MIISIKLFSQTYNYRNLQYRLPLGGDVTELEGLQKINFNQNENNIIMINKIPNINLPNYKNSDYNSKEKQNEFLLINNDFIDKILEVKNTDICKASLNLKPQFVNTGNIFLIAYSIKNILEQNNIKQNISELYFMIPNNTESYLIIVTSFKHDTNFANKMQKFIDSLLINN